MNNPNASKKPLFAAILKFPIEFAGDLTTV